MVPFDDGIAEWEAPLDVNVGVVVQQHLHAALFLSDDGQLQGGGAFDAERVHQGIVLDQESDKGIPPVVGGNMKGCPAIAAGRVNELRSIGLVVF